jgi:hypothetical protein
VRRSWQLPGGPKLRGRGPGGAVLRDRPAGLGGPADRGRAAGTRPRPGAGAVGTAADHVLADGYPLDALDRGYRALGLAAADGDKVFRQLVLARIIEPADKLDSVRVLEEAGIADGGPSAGSSRAIDGYQQDREWAAAHGRQQLGRISAVPRGSVD